MGVIKGCIKIYSCKRLEEVSEGVQLLVTAIKVVKCRSTKRYILCFKNIQDLFVSKYWLQKEIQDRRIDLSVKFKIKLDRFKTTPSRNQERLVFCMQVFKASRFCGV